MSITDKLFTIDGGHIIDLSSNFKKKVEKIFYEAVEERANEESYLDGVEDVLENMKTHGMVGTAEIVERNLIADGVLEAVNDVGGDEGRATGGVNEESKRDKWIDDVISMIG